MNEVFMKKIIIGMMALTSISAFADCKIKYEFVQPNNAVLSENDHVAIVSKVLESKGYSLTGDKADLIVKIETFGQFGANPLESSVTQSIVSITNLSGNELARSGSVSHTIFGKGTVGHAKKAAKSLPNCEELELNH